MFKKLIFMLSIICFIYIFGMVAFAAPEVINPGHTGNSDNIISVTNPDDGITTFKKHVVVSVIANEGVVVSLYSYNPNTNKFEIYTDKAGVNSWQVGPSGLFVKRLPINLGINYVGILGELNGKDQFITRRADQADLSIKDEIKGILINKIQDVMGN